MNETEEDNTYKMEWLNYINDFWKSIDLNISPWMIIEIYMKWLLIIDPTSKGMIINRKAIV